MCKSKRSLKIDCPACNQSGRITKSQIGSKIDLPPCPRCGGEGEILIKNLPEGETVQEVPCPNCNAEGTIKSKKQGKEEKVCEICGGETVVYKKEVHPSKRSLQETEGRT